MSLSMFFNAASIVIGLIWMGIMSIFVHDPGFLLGFFIAFAVMVRLLLFILCGGADPREVGR